MTNRPLTLADRSRLLVDGNFTNTALYAYLLKAQYFATASLPQNITANYLRRKHAIESLKNAAGRKEEIARNLLLEWAENESVEMEGEETNLQKPSDATVMGKMDYVFSRDAGVLPEHS